MKDYESITRLYESYRYQLEDVKDNYAVFSLQSAVYPGVDIVAENVDTDQIKEVKANYASAGFATKCVKYESLQTLEDDLFKKFFTPESARKRLLESYKRYVDNIVSPYKEANADIKYEYIKTKYLADDDFITVKNTDVSIISKLGDLINGDGAKLIIVEASAGFGKTSTAYELVRVLCEDGTMRRPFFMKLEKDRNAKTFRYLLLSQIEQNFDVQLRTDLVMNNIKNGRIPLIIDGFDELLSKDLDSDASNSFVAVETMLSTVCSLLKNQCKIVLTTRKTAIFSGDNFMTWYYKMLDDGENFTLHRIQLQEPIIEDWLSKDKLEQLPPTIVKIKNPVMLSYLRYNDIEHLKNLSSSKALVDKYFEFLLQREMVRQDLPFKPSEQKEILENLAVYFTAFDMTSTSRSDVLGRILELNNDIISGYVTSVKDEKNLANTLTNHALLDRHQTGNIGFINDFIFGTLLGYAFLNKNITEKTLIEQLSMSCSDKLIEACSIWDADSAASLANEIYPYAKHSSDILFLIDRFLMHEIKHRFDGLLVENETLQNVNLIADGGLENCTFANCKFVDCTLNFNLIKNCTFISCDLSTSTCDGNRDDCFFYEINSYSAKDSQQSDLIEAETASDTEKIDAMILQSFFRVNTQNTRVNRISSIFATLSKAHSKKELRKRLDFLHAKRYIYMDGDIAWILQGGSDYYATLNQ
jgi:hypothetical protein